jgi:NAD(P)-dependent dehydrogenase (short-subunit alcohol dehydrogenase family)
MALALAEAGADLVVTARTKKEIEETASHIRALGRRAISLVCDVTKRSSVDRVVDRAVSKLERLDILVNNAGMAIVKPFLEFDLKEWHATIDTNLTSMFLFCQAVGPIMMKQGGGRIINLTSVLGTKGRAGMVPYAASKGGVIQFTRNLAVEWAPFDGRRFP